MSMYSYSLSTSIPTYSQCSVVWCSLPNLNTREKISQVAPVTSTRTSGMLTLRNFYTLNLLRVTDVRVHMRLSDCERSAENRVIAAANKDVCFACGEAVPRASERRNLTSSSSTHVLNLWKAVLQSEL